ncbi:hypothetical protein [Methylobacterium oryzihabitans]|uniref:Uncharacterized protein n=1 Tax=Methylobacterium oryzihabitans TaxID=2499852 RepID=A0A3S2YNG2_9HYPH|nr:hypothetical protein [Methylobacterium oryzihabitans]RVU15203.1 hypothetical protein EOE48_20560 [Methylobacterium oryzihabitans]
MPRERLPARRGTATFTFFHDGIEYRVQYSLYADGRLGEIFLNGGKLDTQADILARDCAIAASLAFQCGCTADALRAALTRTGLGGPAGPLAVALDIIAADRGSARVASEPGPPPIDTPPTAAETAAGPAHEAAL